MEHSDLMRQAGIERDAELRQVLKTVPEGCDCHPRLHRTPTVVGGWYWDHDQECAYVQKVLNRQK